MVKHHPDDNMLAEFSAGSLDWGLSLAVSAHTHFCDVCKSRINELNRVGAALVECAPAIGTDAGSLDRLMARIRAEEGLRSDAHNDDRSDGFDDAEQENLSTEKVDGSVTRPAGDAGGNVAGEVSKSSVSRAPRRDIQDEIVFDKNLVLVNAPKVVRKLIPTDRKLRWKFVSPALRMTRLQTGQNKYEVALHRISTGGRAAEHDHRGKEVTLVLQGSFSDRDGVYSQGDFITREPGEIHQPTAARNDECICLTVLEAPVAVTGLLGRIVNPLLNIRPR